MRCLWLTLADPDPPRNGQFLYSGGLIQAIAAAGTEVHVVGLSLPGARHHNGQHEGRIHWWLARHRPRSKWAGLISALPHIAGRTKTRSMQNILRELLNSDHWDAIVFDSISTGWALSAVLERYSRTLRRPRLVYLSHNHEENLAMQVAYDERHPLKRQIKHLEALKVARLERALVRNADLVTSNSPEDCAKFLGKWPDKPVEFLPPGYGGPRLGARRITRDVPRRAIIVGSFDWIAKRVNLEEFLKVADRLFASAGVELYVVGSAEESYLSRLHKRFVATTFTGRVDDITHYMRQARVALVVERFGGFKLKVLDYVFNRLPILGISGSVPGLPLRLGESIMLFPDHKALAEGVLRVIDNFELLNGIQEFAYAACCNQFDWASIGRRLLLAMSIHERPRQKNAPVDQQAPSSFSSRASASLNAR